MNKRLSKKKAELNKWVKVLIDSRETRILERVNGKMAERRIKFHTPRNSMAAGIDAPQGGNAKFDHILKNQEEKALIKASHSLTGLDYVIFSGPGILKKYLKRKMEELSYQRPKLCLMDEDKGRLTNRKFGKFMVFPFEKETGNIKIGKKSRLAS